MSLKISHLLSKRIKRGRILGFSLTELLVVLLVSLIVTGVGFSLYRLNASYYMKEDAYLQQYQNLRVALFTIGRDARMAGNGFGLFGPNLKLIQTYVPTLEVPKVGTPPTEVSVSPGFYRHSDSLLGASGARAIYGVDGGNLGSDTLTIFRAEVESGNPLAAVKDYQSSSDTIKTDIPIPSEAIKVGDIVAIGNKDRCYIAEVASLSSAPISSLTLKQGGRFTNAVGPVIPSSDSVLGDSIYNFRDVVFVTYYLDQSTNQLMADYHDVSRTNYDDSAKQTSVVAYNIEDFQVFYFFESETVDNSKLGQAVDVSSARLNSERVKAVTIGLVSVSSYGSGSNDKKRPKLFNRDEGAVSDNKFRSVLVETIYLRNFHI
jgi:Tfp pilus assembly protein PilW